MQKYTKRIIQISLLIILAKIIFISLISTPTIYTDEYVYIKMAQSFSENFNFNIHSIETDKYHPLYPIVLAISFIFKNTIVSYWLMKFLNIILSTLIIIPAYLIAKEFLDEKKSLISATIITILPMSFIFSGFIMAENLFYPLFLFSVYFMYKSYFNIKYGVLAAIFIALTIFTRAAGISLILIYIVSIIIIILSNKIIEKKSKLNKKTLIVSILVVLASSIWIIFRAIKFGFTPEGILGEYALEITKQNSYYLLNLLYWILIYSSYLMLASMIIFSIMVFTKFKEKINDKKFLALLVIVIISIFTIILGAANHAAQSDAKENTYLSNLNGRPIGRYVDTVLPLIFLIGLITYFKDHNKINKIAKILILIFVLISSILFYFILLPANNISLTIWGSIQLILNSSMGIKGVILSLTLITLLSSYLIIRIYEKPIFKLNILNLTFIFLIITNILAASATIYNSKVYWETNPQIQLSKWMNENINSKSTILIDQDYCGNLDKSAHKVLCSNGKSTTLTGLWITNPIAINTLNLTQADYIITLKELDLELVKKTENNIYLYKGN
jgi:asparagine N-glycosylation enzyme membrane subunit Stt3